jgi:hypothetical protein
MRFMDFFGPLNKDSCKYFYYVSIIAGISLAITSCGALFVVITHFKKLDFLMISSIAQILINTFIVYFLNRILYSMCIGSLK